MDTPMCEEYRTDSVL